MILMRQHPLLGQVGGGWALEISTFLGPKWYSPVGSTPLHRVQNSLDFQGSTPSHLPCCPHLKHYTRGRINLRCINSYYDVLSLNCQCAEIFLTRCIYISAVEKYWYKVCNDSPRANIAAICLYRNLLPLLQVRRTDKIQVPNMDSRSLIVAESRSRK